MLRITVQINEKVIGEFAAVRTSDTAKGTNQYDILDVTNISSKESVYNGEMIGKIEHNYGDGANVLSQKILEEVDGSQFK